MPGPELALGLDQAGERLALGQCDADRLVPEQGDRQQGLAQALGVDLDRLVLHALRRVVGHAAGDADPAALDQALGLGARAALQGGDALGQAFRRRILR